MKKLLGSIKNYISIGGYAVAVATMYLMFAGLKDSVAETKEKASKLEEGFYQQAVTINRLNDNFALLLQLNGFDKDKIKQWQEMPKTPPVDSLTGQLIPNAEWLFISPGMIQGRIMKLVDSAKIVSVTAWNIGEKK